MPARTGSAARGRRSDPSTVWTSPACPRDCRRRRADGGVLSGLLGRSRSPSIGGFPVTAGLVVAAYLLLAAQCEWKVCLIFLIAILAGAIAARSLAVDRQPGPSGDLAGLSAALIKIPKVRNMSQRRIG